MPASAAQREFSKVRVPAQPLARTVLRPVKEKYRMGGQSQFEPNRDSRPDLSIVLPCYNKAQGLEALVRRFAEAVQGTILS